jgi:hypothetical protein
MENKLAILLAVMTLTVASEANAQMHHDVGQSASDRLREKCSEVGTIAPDLLSECVQLAADEIAVLKEEKEMLKSEVCVLYGVVKELGKGAVSAGLLDSPKHCKIPIVPGRSR